MNSHLPRNPVKHLSSPFIFTGGGQYRGSEERSCDSRARITCSGLQISLWSWWRPEKGFRIGQRCDQIELEIVSEENARVQDSCNKWHSDGAKWQWSKENKRNLRSSFRNKSFPGGSYGKESACKVGDPGSIPGSGRFRGEGNGNPFQYVSSSKGDKKKLKGNKDLSMFFVCPSFRGT